MRYSKQQRTGWAVLWTEAAARLDGERAGEQGGHAARDLLDAARLQQQRRPRSPAQHVRPLTCHALGSEMGMTRIREGLRLARLHPTRPQQQGIFATRSSSTRCHARTCCR